MCVRVIKREDFPAAPAVGVVGDMQRDSIGLWDIQPQVEPEMVIA